MRRVLYLSLLLFVFVSSCQKKEVTTQPVCEEIFPFGITSTVNGFYIYPYGDEIKEIKKAEFWFYKTELGKYCTVANSYFGTFMTSVTYTALNGEKLLFVRAEKDETYHMVAKITRRCKGDWYSYTLYSGILGTERVKFLPFKEFDSPLLYFEAVQSTGNFLYYGGEFPYCKKLPENVDKYTLIEADLLQGVYGCYTLSNNVDIYCETVSGEVKVYAGKVDKYYPILLEEGHYRIWILSGEHFMIYDFFTEPGDIRRIFEEDNIRKVFPSLSHTYNQNGYDSRLWDLNSEQLNLEKYFYLLKTTDENMVEILRPDLTRDYLWYWKPVNEVSYYFMDVTLPIEKREDYLPRGVIFQDGDVYLEDFGKEYHFPFKIEKLWMVRYPGKIWDRYSGFMVGSDGYIVLVTDSAHFDFVRFKDYEEIKDISWFSVVGVDGSFSSLILLYMNSLNLYYKEMCNNHYLNCNNLCSPRVLCNQIGLPVWDDIPRVALSPFLPSTRKWYVDCGEIEPEVK